MEEEKKKKKSIIGYFLLMLLLTFLVLIIGNLIPSLFTIFIFNSKYGYEVISELFFGIIVLFIVIMSKNGFILSKKRESFFKSIKYGISIFIFAIIIFLSNLDGLVRANFSVTINLLLYCIAIGITEEFLCRGWIQNQFLKKFGNSRKGVLKSIICASLIFGIIHLLNLLSGQTPLETIIQVLQATSSGFLFGAIYYKTGNIWSTVFLHAFYDFSIFLGESTNYVDCMNYANPSLAITLYSYFSSLVIISLYAVNGIKILDKESVNNIIGINTNEDENEKEMEFKKQKRNKKLTIAMIVLFVLLFMPINVEGIDDISICYNFAEYKVEGNYELRYIKQDIYQINNKIGEEEYTLNFFIDDSGNLKIENPNTGYLKTFIDNVFDYEIVKSNNKYILVVDQFSFINEKKYYLEIEENTITADEKYIEELQKNIKEIVTPTMVELGYIYINEGEYIYPFIKTDLDDIFIIRDAENINILVN